MTTPRHFDTIAVHGGAAADPTTGARAVPIYQTVAYNFRDTDHAADLFGLREFGNIYSRIMNPTNDVLEQRIAQLEGGSAALALSSGHAAEVLGLLNVAGTGDSIIASTSLYGGTWNIFLHTFRRLGIEVRFVETTDTEGFAAASDDTTKAWFVETIGNPRLDVPDIAGLADAGRALNIPLFVDNTFATPYLSRPIEHGAAVVVESLTKWLGGHGTSIGGILVDGGNFDWGGGRHPFFTEPDESYHGLKFWDVFGDFPGLGNVAFAIRARVNLLRDLGQLALAVQRAAVPPRRGDALPSRAAARRQRARRGQVPRDASRRSSGSAIRASTRTRPRPTPTSTSRTGTAGWSCSGSRAGKEAGRKLIDSVQLFSHLANVGDAKSLIIHPATTTHSQLSEDELVKAGISDDFVRLSVGIEGIDDILADLEQALGQV